MINKGNSALFGIIKQARRENLPIDIQFELFDMMVLPVILYGAEVWGSMNLKTLESLHLKFCKMVLKLKRSTPDIMVYGETGRFQVEYYAKKRIINFWSRVASGSTDKSSYKMYILSKQLHDSGRRTSTWYLNLVKILESYGITNVPVESENIKAVVKIMHESLKSEYITKWKAEVG